MGGAVSTTGPAGSLFVLLTDIYQSSRLSEQYPEQYEAALARHNAVVEETVGMCAGQIYKNTGDGYMAFFEQASDCLACAVQLQREFAAFGPFAHDDQFLVRVVAHGGAVRVIGGEYFGPALNRISRICQVCHPGQALASAVVVTRARGKLPGSAELLDLGEHHLRDLNDPEHLYQLDHQGFVRHEFPPLPTLKHRPNNLVRQPNAFIGRERELADLKALLLDTRRLVTITAAGGYGKSRLAAHLCADLLTAFERGVFFVELAPLRDHTGITTALASAIEFQFYGKHDPEEQLLDYLREKELLLCFDNFEHVLPGASFIGDVLKGASQVKIVVTSREPLHITGEQVYPLGPLPVVLPAQADQRHGDAVLLFADRAALASPSFALDRTNLASVQAICELLDGIPLAIELAAAWADHFSLAELRDEFAHQHELTARLSDVPKRHRSLRASLDWSWSLLSEAQQRMLMQLSTFHGGCFVEAASGVLGMQGVVLRQELAQLADKSWLYTRHVGGQARFFVRDAASYEYAFGKLEETRADGAGSLYGEAVMAHARYFSELMEREGERLHGQGQLEALSVMRLELQNIYEAIDTLLSRLKQQDVAEESAALLLPIVRWLGEFLNMTREYREHVACYQALKEVAEQSPGLKQIQLWVLLGCAHARQWLPGDYETTAAESARNLAVTLGDRQGIAMSLNNLGGAEWGRGSYDAAREYHTEALAVSHEIGDRHGIAMALNHLGTVEWTKGNYDAARELHTESLAIRREISDRYGVARALNNLGLVEAHQGNYDAARELHTESLAMKREFGDRNGIAASLNNLGDAEYSRGNYDAARELHTESLAIKREIGDRYGIAMSLINLGGVEQSQGNYDAARELYTESLAIQREIGEPPQMLWWTLSKLGLVEHSQGNYDAARELHAEALASFRDTGHRTGVCTTVAAIAWLLATTGEARAGSICLHGTRHHATQLSYAFEPIEGELVKQTEAIFEHPETGLPLDEREGLKAQAEGMSLDELAEYALEALKKLEVE